MPVPVATGVTLVAAASGLSTIIANLFISQKTKGRLEVTEEEVIMAMLAVGLGSMIAYVFFQTKKEAEQTI